MLELLNKLLKEYEDDYEGSESTLDLDKANEIKKVIAIVQAVKNLAKVFNELSSADDGGNMNTQVGSCPKCGAPIYSPSMWHGITPPPITHTCQCVPQPKTIISTSSGELKGGSI